MRLSIIIPFLNSHEIVRRQIIHLRGLDLPDDVEIIFLDDGSIPPLEMPKEPLKNFLIHATNDYRPWTSSIARNVGAKIARGSYLLMTDGDYILSRSAIDRARSFDKDRLGFKREFGVLDRDGKFTQNYDVLVAWGVSQRRLEEHGPRIPTHPNNFVMRATLFQELGGYDERIILSRPYPQGEDRGFKRKLVEFVRAGKCTMSEENRAVIYMFPNGQYCGDVDYNPFGLFHSLTRKTLQNHWYLNPRYPRDEA